MSAQNDQLEPQTAASEQSSPAADSVGALLRSQRLALGRDVAFVAEHLRIRAAYIRAIEDGRYMDLPGSTYAIGFVRSYADFLGLDGPETVRRFKDETAGGLHNKPELFFPSPVSEGRIPGGAILFLGLVLAATAYGAWYYTSSREVSIAELVPALPERLQAMIGMSGSSEPPLAEGPIIAAPKPEGEAAKAEAAPPATPPAAPVQTAAVAPASAPVAKPGDAAKSPEPGKPAQPPAVPAASTVAATPSAAHVDQAVPPDEEEAAPKPAPAAAPTPAPSTEFPQPAGNGKMYGAYNTSSRVAFRATDTTWVEVYDKDKRLWANTLKKGDVYRVPNKAGLTMMIGSAGAIDVYVDGKQTPSLGRLGSRRNGVLLDPEKLQAGQ